MVTKRYEDLLPAMVFMSLESNLKVVNQSVSQNQGLILTNINFSTERYETLTLALSLL